MNEIEIKSAFLKKQSFTQIAEASGLSREEVHQILRRQTPYKIVIKNGVTEEHIIDEYITKRKRLGEVVKELGVAQYTVFKVLWNHGLDTRGHNETREINISKEFLEECLAKNMTHVEIAEKLGVGHGSIHNYLVKYNMPLKSQKESLTDRGYGILWNDENLAKCKALLEQGLMYKEVAAIMGSTEGAINTANLSRLHVPMSIWQDEIFTEKVRQKLEETRNFAETAAAFNISEDRIQWKNNRLWRIDLSANSTLFGIPTIYNGVQYRSKKETLIAKYFTERKIKFEYEKKVCEGHTWTCDFYLPKHDLWIEYDGLDDWRSRIKGQISYNNGNAKIIHYRNNNYKHIILTKRHWLKQLNDLGTSLGWAK